VRWGVKMSPTDDRVQVTGVEAGSPASAVDTELPQGTIVLSVNDRDTTGWTVVDIIGTMTDTSITELKLGVCQPSDYAASLPTAEEVTEEEPVGEATLVAEDPAPFSFEMGTTTPDDPKEVTVEAITVADDATQPFSFATKTTNPDAPGSTPLAAPETTDDAPEQGDMYGEMGRFAVIKVLRARSVDYSHCTNVDELRALARETDPDAPAPQADKVSEMAKPETNPFSGLLANLEEKAATSVDVPASTMTELPDGSVRIDLYRGTTDQSWGLKIGTNRGDGVPLKRSKEGTPADDVTSSVVGWRVVDLNDENVTALETVEIADRLRDILSVALILQPPRDAQDVDASSGMTMSPPRADSLEEPPEPPERTSRPEPQNSVTKFPNGNIEVSLIKTADQTWGLKFKEEAGVGLSFKKSPDPDSVAGWGGHIVAGGKLVEVNGIDATGWGKGDIKPYVVDQDQVTLRVSYAHIYSNESEPGADNEPQLYDNIDHGDDDEVGAPTIAPPPPPSRTPDRETDAAPTHAPPLPPDRGPSLAVAVDFANMKRLQCIKILREHNVDYTFAKTIEEYRDLVRVALGLSATEEEEYSLPIIEPASRSIEDTSAAGGDEEEELYAMPISARDRDAARAKQRDEDIANAMVAIEATEEDEYVLPVRAAVE
jgi:hypothetical protein